MAQYKISDGIIEIPNGVTKIPDNAFSEITLLDNKELTKIVIPETVTEIGNCAFFACENLTSVILPSGLRKIGEYAFYGCKKITSIVIPITVEEIGQAAFECCSSLRTITLPAKLTSFGISMFYYCNALETIYVPNNLLDFYTKLLMEKSAFLHKFFPEVPKIVALKDKGKESMPKDSEPVDESMGDEGIRDIEGKFWNEVWEKATKPLKEKYEDAFDPNYKSTAKNIDGSEIQVTPMDEILRWPIYNDLPDLKNVIDYLLDSKDDALGGFVETKEFIRIRLIGFIKGVVIDVKDTPKYVFKGDSHMSAKDLEFALDDICSYFHTYFKYQAESMESESQSKGGQE